MCSCMRSRSCVDENVPHVGTPLSKCAFIFFFFFSDTPSGELKNSAVLTWDESETKDVCAVYASGVHTLNVQNVRLVARPY